MKIPTPRDPKWGRELSGWRFLLVIAGYGTTIAIGAMTVGLVVGYVVYRLDMWIIEIFK